MELDTDLNSNQIALDSKIQNFFDDLQIKGSQKQHTTKNEDSKLFKFSPQTLKSQDHVSLMSQSTASSSLKNFGLKLNFSLAPMASSSLSNSDFANNSN